MTTLSARIGQSMASGSRQLLSGMHPREWLTRGKELLLPLVGILLFLGFWHLAAPQVETSLGAFPGPVQVWEQSGQLWQEHASQRERADKFITMQEERNARILADNPQADVRIRDYRGVPIFLAQEVTSQLADLTRLALASWWSKH